MTASVPSEASEGMTTTKRSHIGRAGDHAVMAEFLLRGWNVAIPEVDVGDDIFVVDDNADRVIRVQVKTAERVQPAGGGVRAVYAGIPLTRFWGGTLAFFYVFVLRHAGRWEFVVIDRRTLRDERSAAEESGEEGATRGRGGRPKRTATNSAVDTKALLSLALYFTPSHMTLWGRSVQAHRNNWSAFPEINAGPGATSRGARSSASATPRPRPRSRAPRRLTQ